MTAGAIAVPTIVPLRPPLPGKPKNSIDTDTKIEISSATPDSTIYYTTNGTKPDPFQTIGAKSTFKYSQPFRLPGGKITVKALALAPDGLRESSIVAKVFDVEDLDPDPSTPNGPKTPKRTENKLLTTKKVWAEMEKLRQTEQMMTDMSLVGSSKRKPQAGTRFMNNRMGTPGRAGENMDDWVNGSDISRTPRKQPPDTATQAMRLQRETDFLKCIYCFAPRPSDPYARFCNECGSPVPPLPQTRMPPPEAGQMGMCVYCKSVVPFNTTSCVVCESPIGPQNQPQASIKLHNKLICTSCGTANPNNLSQCVTCETKLVGLSKPIFSGTSAALEPKTEGRLVTCSKCGRTNNSDARFCDWCGAKPSHPASNLVCSKCGSSNQPYAQFCGSCGVLMDPPPRMDSRNSGFIMNTNAKNAQAQWLPMALPHQVPRSTVATQTIGLFYPSNKEIDRKKLEEEDKLSMEKQIRDRRPLMTAISPGKGYWRKQMDHICAHMKAHAQNDKEFQALIGEPKMGKIISTEVHEDGYELSLTVNFALRGNKDPFTGKKMGLTHSEFLSSYTQQDSRPQSMNTFRSYASQESLVSTARSTARSTTSKRGKKRVTKKVKRTNENEAKLTAEDKELLKEVGKNGEGDADEVERLIDEGADPNCVNKDGMPVLHVAVINKQIDAIPVLIQRGADVNKKGPNKGNTALHEAVGLGSSGQKVVDTLMGCGASSQKKNDKGESPYDLAVKEGDETICQKFTTTLGQQALDKLIKPKTMHEVEAF